MAAMHVLVAGGQQQLFRDTIEENIEDDWDIMFAKSKSKSHVVEKGWVLNTRGHEGMDSRKLNGIGPVLPRPRPFNGSQPRSVGKEAGLSRDPGSI